MHQRIQMFKYLNPWKYPLHFIKHKEKLQEVVIFKRKSLQYRKHTTHNYNEHAIYLVYLAFINGYLIQEDKM